MKVAARVWRHVPPGAEPLHLGRLFRFSEGRWNVRGEYACLYTALTRDGALGELQKARATRGSIVGPRDVVSINIEIEPVLDLRDAEELKALSSAAGVACSPGRLVADGKSAYAYCHRLAEEARRQGYTGLLVPSGAVSGESNLIVYFDIVAPKQIVIDNGPDRERVDP